jgi:hypothetical protein
MALELAWTSSSGTGSMLNVINPYGTYGNTEATAAVWELCWLKNRLIEKGWTFVSCSNGSVTSSSDLLGPNDNFTTASNTWASARGDVPAPSAPRTWYMLKAPASGAAAGHYFIVDYTNTYPVVFNECRVVFAKGDLAGTGSIYNRPYFYYEFGCAFGSTPYGTRDFAFFNGAVGDLAQHRVNLHTTPDGAFCFSEVKVGSNQFSNVLSFMPLQNVHAADQWTWVSVTNDFANAFGGAVGFAQESYGGLTGRSHEGLTGLNLAGLLPAVYSEATQNLTPLFAQSSLMLGPNTSDSTYSDFPIVVANTLNGPIEIKGRLPDITWTSFNIPDGAVTPPKALPGDKYDKVKHRNFWLPWVSTVSPVL